MVYQLHISIIVLENFTWYFHVVQYSFNIPIHLILYFAFIQGRRSGCKSGCGGGAHLAPAEGG